MEPKEQSRLLGIFLGQALENYRTKNNIKQKDLAELLNVDERTLRRWEKGQIPQNVIELKRIADALGMDYESLGISPAVYIPRTLEQIDEDIKQAWNYIKQARYTEGRIFVDQLVRDVTLQITKEDPLSLHRLALVRQVAGHMTSEASRTDSVFAAYQHYHEMEEIARILNDHTLLNIALTYEGDMLRRKGDIPQAVGYLEAARDITPQADAETRGNSYQLLARAYLAYGNMDGFERAMSEAERLSDVTLATGSINGYYSLGAVYEEYGKDYGWRGETEKGMKYIDLATKHLPSTPHWDIVLKTAQAMALVRGGYFSEGGQLAIEAAYLCHQTGNKRMLERVYSIQRYLQEVSYEVRQINDPLREALNGPFGSLEQL